MKSLTLSRLLYLVYLFLVGFPLLFLLTSLCCILLIAASYLHVPASFISRVTKCWSWSCLAATLCRVEVRGREHLPSSSAPCVVVANHQSAYDIFVLNAYIGIPFKWVMKSELRRSRLWGEPAKPRASSLSMRRVSPPLPIPLRMLSVSSPREAQSLSSLREVAPRRGV